MKIVESVVAVVLLLLMMRNFVDSSSCERKFQIVLD